MVAEVRLREVVDDDLPVFFEHWNDPEANRMAAFTAADPSDRTAFEARWARLRSDSSVTNRTIEVDAQVAGTISSWDNDGTREITYWLGREHWGKGAATAAVARFVELEPVRPLYGVAAKDNAASIRVLQKCGFVPVGESKGYANARGEEIDEIILALQT